MKSSVCCHPGRVKTHEEEDDDSDDECLGSQKSTSLQAIFWINYGLVTAMTNNNFMQPSLHSTSVNGYLPYMIICISILWKTTTQGRQRWRWRVTEEAHMGNTLSHSTGHHTRYMISWSCPLTPSWSLIPILRPPRDSKRFMTMIYELRSINLIAYVTLIRHQKDWDHCEQSGYGKLCRHVTTTAARFWSRYVNHDTKVCKGWVINNQHNRTIFDLLKLLWCSMPNTTIEQWALRRNIKKHEQLSPTWSLKHADHYQHPWGAGSPDQLK